MSTEIVAVIALCLAPFVLFGAIELITRYRRHQASALARRNKAKQLNVQRDK